MTESVFTKVFSYRQHDNHSPLENFLTEIFSFCIEVDLVFRQDFFKKILDVKLDETVFNISTQENYPAYGRPDIEITFGTTSILMECKVEADERKNQLKDYASILIKQKPKFPNRHIVFLTKYFEHKEIADNRVQLHLIRWYQVYDLINDNHHEITQQLKIFLKEKDMENAKNFNIQDLLAMKTITTTLTKMDELLEQLKPEFKKNFGGYSSGASRSTRLQDECYINYVTLNFNKQEYWLLVGFFWWWSDDFEIPSVGLSFEIPHKKFESSDFIEILKRELVNKNNWEFDDTDSQNYYISKYKPITDFITNEDDNIPAMKKSIQENLNTLYRLKEKQLTLFRK